MEPNLLKRYTPQKLKWFSNALVIHLVDFPIYYIECISERHFIIAGGGGSSKTGVHNQINILELIPTGESCAAELIMKYHTPEDIPDAIMTGSLIKDSSIISTRLVTGGSNATIYFIEYDNNKKNFEIIDHKCLKDDKIRIEMKSVLYMPGKIFTGGLDGHIYIWDSNDKILEHKIKAHGKEIDEIDVNLIDQQIVTLARDESRCAVWNISNYKLIYEFKKDFINNDTNVGFKYAYRSCKYAYNTNLDSTKRPSVNSYLLIACNPIPAKGSSMIYRLSSNNFKDIKTAFVTTDGIMAMTVSSDGNFVAIGTRSGNVNIFGVKNFKQIYKVEGAHSNAITNLAFLPTKPESLSLTNSKTCALLSASIDRRIVLHRPEKNSLTSKLCKVLFMVMMLYLLFFVIYSNYVAN